MTRILSVLVLGTLVSTAPALATVIPFSGPLRIIELNDGGIYSGASVGTVFNGEIDDANYSGFISDGTTTTPFSCPTFPPDCLAAGPLEIQDNVVLDMDQANFLNDIAGETIFSMGNIVDVVDIEGDERTTLPLGRIEAGVSLVVDGSIFPSDDPANYNFPLVRDNLLLGLYFINEDDSEGREIYTATGRIDVIPLPASVWLFGSALGLLGWIRRKAV